MPQKTARLFNNRGSQAVRLPVEFRFDGDEVYVRRDQRTGDVILSGKSGWSTWKEYLKNRDCGAAVAAEFMRDRPLNAPLIDEALLRDER
jgi:antitoxin VapB